MDPNTHLAAALLEACPINMPMTVSIALHNGTMTQPIVEPHDRHTYAAHQRIALCRAVPRLTSTTPFGRLYAQVPLFTQAPVVPSPEGMHTIATSLCQTFTIMHNGHGTIQRFAWKYVAKMIHVPIAKRSGHTTKTTTIDMDRVHDDGTTIEHLDAFFARIATMQGPFQPWTSVAHNEITRGLVGPDSTEDLLYLDLLQRIPNAIFGPPPHTVERWKRNFEDSVFIPRAGVVR